MVEDFQCTQLDLRPKSVFFYEKVTFLISYKVQNFFKSTIVGINVNTGECSDNIKELPCAQSLFLGVREWVNPPVLLLHDDRQSYSLILNEDLQLDQELEAILSEDDKHKVWNCMKQSLNLKVTRIFWSPLRNGMVVLYLSENLLRFSRNRLEENSITDFLMLTCKDYIFLCWQHRNISCG